MTAPWRQTLPAAEPMAAAVRSALPRIETARLLLRAPTIADWTTLEPIWTTKRGRFIGGPFGEEDAYLDFCQSVAGWILRGIGALTIEDKATGEVLGLTGLFVEYGDPETVPELGWLLTEAAEGRGIASEAAQAVREHAFGAFGFDRLVSYIAAENDRSIRLAESLGAVADPAGFVDSDGDNVLVFRHVRVTGPETGGADV